MKSSFSIIPARREDAPLIARAIVMAVGEEITRDFAAPDHTPQDVEAMFADLAAMDDSQYSYRNTLVALNPEGRVAGVCIAYDGALLHSLRERFIEAVRRHLGREMGEMADETSPDEYYLDSLAVWPQYRGQGIGAALLMAQARRAHAAGKPAGLLVDKDNPRARALYTRLGFLPAGERPFAGTTMDHLILP